MKATWDKLEKNWMQFEVEVEASEFSKSIEAAFRKMNQQVTIPGFRRGKAPRAIFERMYGKEALVQEAVEQLLPRAYGQAVEQGQVEPIAQPEIELVQAEEGRPFIFKGKVQVLPEVTLGRLSGFGIEKTVPEITDEQVEEQLNALRERLATLVSDEAGEVVNGSFAVIDFEGFIDGEPFEGGKGEGYTLEIGSGTFIPGFEEGLLGAKAGETRDVNVTFPEEYHAEHLAGKPAVFKVTVQEVKKKELPELNDEFAQQVSPFKTVEELRGDIKNRLTEAAQQNAEREFRNKIVEAVTNDAAVEVPEVMVSDKVHDMIHDFEHQLAQQGFTLEMWHRVTGKTHEDLHKEFGPRAEQAVKTDLVLAAVAKREGLTVSEAEIEAEFDRLLAMYPRQKADIERLRKNAGYRARMREDLLAQKAVEHLVALNTAA
ncbi:trigger factor [Symbiobacterium terraclitae]|uniref:trigger factor n=1 Tax=Symbiobacterium terraclitae TaxID=557451 RepID=UPI0035B54975